MSDPFAPKLASKRGFLLATAFCGVVFLITSAPAQEKLPDVLDRLAEHRSGLNSYVAKITIVSFSTNDYGPPVGVHRGFLVREIGVVADKTQNSVLSCSTSYSAESSRSSTSEVILRRGKKFWITAGQKFSSAERPRADNLIEPDIIGLAFCAELGRFTTFKELLANYGTWGNRSRLKSRDDSHLAVFQDVTFDTQRGYSPLQTGDSNHVSVRCEPELTDEGLWLPEHAFYQCNGDNGMYIHVEWLAINRPISPSLFRPETVAKLAGYEFQGAAAPGAPRPGELPHSITPQRKAHQSLRESWATLGTSYRDLYQQTWLRPKFESTEISSKQLEAAHEFLNNNRTNLPDFQLLTKDTDSVDAFFSSLAQRLDEANMKYEMAFQELLEPEQTDALTGLYIARNGLEAFANYAVQKRFAMSKQQVESAKEQVRERRAIAREIWVDTSTYSERDPTLSKLDFRAAATLTRAEEFLDKRQLSLLASLLEYVPKSTQQRLTFGF